MARHAVGIDIGGTGIKGAVVDLDSGELVTDRCKLLTPSGGRPEDVLDTVQGVLDMMGAARDGLSVGIAFPSVITGGVTRTAANIDQSWVGLQADELFSERLGQATHLVNDADAAGIAEMRFGAARGQDGVVIVTTLGTGIGSAIFVDGKLVPNTEFGHLDVGGVVDYEKFASSVVREREGLAWGVWAKKRLQPFYRQLETLFWPDLFVVGGGVSKKHEKFLPLLKIRTPIVPAELRNNAGILGAAWLGAEGA